MEENQKTTTKPNGRILSLVIVGIAFFSFAFWELSTYEFVIDSQQKLLDYDFSPEISKLEVVDRQHYGSRWLGLKSLGAKARSPEDELILAGRVLQGHEYIWSHGAVFGPLSPFVATENRLPRHGVELYPELNTKAGISAFYKLSREERLLKYYEGINMFTGKFYTSFDAAAKHEPGGIRVWPLHPSGDYFKGHSGTSASDVSFNYKKLGFNAGHVLYEDMCRSDGISIRDRKPTLRALLSRLIQ